MSLYSVPKLLRLFSRKTQDPSTIKKLKPDAQKFSKIKKNQENFASQDPLSLEFQKFVMEQMKKDDKEAKTVGMSEKIMSNEKLSKLTKAFISGEVVDLDSLDQSAFKEFEEIEKEFEGDKEGEMNETLDSILKDLEKVESDDKD